MVEFDRPAWPGPATTIRRAEEVVSGWMKAYRGEEGPIANRPQVTNLPHKFDPRWAGVKVGWGGVKVGEGGMDEGERKGWEAGSRSAF
jgi:hypothetical protein